MASNYLLGIDVGSSSVKCSLVDVFTGRSVAFAQSPSEEMKISAVHEGWAEQEPELWWQHVVVSIQNCLKSRGVSGVAIKAIGISYQMHGLVALDRMGQPVRPSIIWCDSRAVEIGQKAYQALGPDFCLQHYLNSPGNFTASKLRWVMENEPHIYEQIHTFFLPGDYIAFRLTGERATTVSGLSEGILWDFHERALATDLLLHYGINSDKIPSVVNTFSIQGQLTTSVASELGLAAGTPVSYRAGDQPNNAFSLHVLHPGETAATAGTSGVIYAVTDQIQADKKSRVNTFVHVTDQPTSPRQGILLCINGTGILNSWLRKQTRASDYDEMNSQAMVTPIGADSLRVSPFGNGAERILENRLVGASFRNLDFNRHTQGHLYRAAQEGIVCSMRLGYDIVQSISSASSVIRAGKSNLFLSPLFREAFVNTLRVPLELYETNGATGAALGAGVGANVYASTEEAMAGLNRLEVIEPDPSKEEQYEQVYQEWKKEFGL
jgi:xylulokinase